MTNKKDSFSFKLSKVKKANKPQTNERQKNMQTVKPNEDETIELSKAATMLKEANAQIASAKKQADASKAILAKWLKEHREIDIDILTVGSIVNIDKVAIVEIGKQKRFDAADFMLKHTELFLSFSREFPVTKYKPLV